MPGRDDDALSWDGDDDPTLDARVGAPLTDEEPIAAAPPADLDARVAPAAGEDTAGHEPPHADDEATTESPPRSAGNASLIGVGVIGGVYLLLSIGWLVGGLRLHSVAGFLVTPDGTGSPVWEAGTLAGAWLAALAPAIWFLAVFVLTRASARWLRWTLLIAGAILLLPWPFIMVGAVGS